MRIINETGIKTNSQPSMAVEKLTKAGFSEKQAKLATTIFLGWLATECKLSNFESLDANTMVNALFPSYANSEQCKPTGQPTIH